MTFLTTIALSLIFVTADTAHGNEVITIPLSEIGGYRRSLRELEPEYFIKRDTPEKRAEYSTPEKLQEILDKAEQSLTLPIERAMHKQVLKEKKSDNPDDWLPSPGFAVVGKDREALKGVHAVIVKSEKPKNLFSPSDQLTIAFFTLRTNGLRLFSAERAGNRITIEYGFIATGRLSSRWALLLIPVGELPSGDYEVKHVRSYAREKKEQQKEKFRRFGKRQAGGQEKVICRDFKFSVSE